MSEVCWVVRRYQAVLGENAATTTILDILFRCSCTPTYLPLPDVRDSHNNRVWEFCKESHHHFRPEEKGISKCSS